MITNIWSQLINTPIQPRSNGPVPAKSLFRSTRGNLITIRNLAALDTGRLVEMLSGISARSLFLRYCMPMQHMAPEMLARETARLAQTNSRQLTVVALTHVDGAEKMVAVAELVRDPSSPAVAEVALLVADQFQREGIGSQLCGYLVAAARRQGLAALRATALAENAAVRRIVAHSSAP